VLDLLDDCPERRAARALAQRAAELPTTEQAVDLLEELGR
jgi:hypothetical protein